VEINPRVEEIGIVANWRAVSETVRRPAVIFGTSSDRIGTPSGQSYFVTASKSLHHDIGLPVAPYVGASWSTHEERVVFPFGMNIALKPNWTAMAMYDGVHTHLSSTVGWRRIAVTLLAIRRRDFGVTIGTTF
jgi:hypothetical protein